MLLKCCCCKNEKDEIFFNLDKGRATKRSPRCKTCNNIRTQKSRAKLKLEVMLYYSGGTLKCQCCGDAHYEFLTIEHINGGGRQHREDIGGGGLLHTWLKKNNFPEGFTVYCYNCNCSRGRYGYCPHTSEEFCF